MELTEIYRRGSEILDNTNLGFVLKGVETEFVLRNNEQILARYKFIQKAINTIEPITATKLLNVELQVPIMMSSIAAPIPSPQKDSFKVVALALKEVGSMMWSGTPAPSDLKEIIEIGVPVAQTTKPFADRSKIKEALAQAEASGVTWVGIEVDAGQGTKILDRQMARGCSPISVAEIKEMKKLVNRPFVLKGILSAWDAEKALEAGADVIVVSNHGAHTIDYLPHPFEVMDDIVRIVGGQIPIIVDGGFRRGTDVLKALAFGARAVGLGRPILYGLAVAGKEGVKAVISEMARELLRAMALTGVKDPSSASKDILLPC